MILQKTEQEAPKPITMEQLQQKYEAIMSWSPKTLFSYLTLSSHSIDINKEIGAVTVSVTWRQHDKSLCIDGALRAKLYTNSGKCAGRTYLVLPKIGTSDKFAGTCPERKRTIKM